MRWIRFAALSLGLAGPWVPSVANAEDDTETSAGTSTPVSTPPPLEPARKTTAPIAVRQVPAPPIEWQRLAPVPVPEGVYPSWRRVLRFSATSPEAELQVQYPGTADWQVVCRGPCTVSAWTPATYRVSGPGIASSQKLGIYPEPRPLVLHARVETPAARTPGIVLTTVGGVAILLGAMITLTDRVTCGLFKSEEEADECGYSPAGTAVMLGGGGLLAWGIVSIARSGTKVMTPAPRRTALAIPLGKEVQLTPRGLEF